MPELCRQISYLYDEHVGYNEGHFEHSGRGSFRSSLSSLVFTSTGHSKQYIGQMSNSQCLYFRADGY